MKGGKPFHIVVAEPIEDPVARSRLEEIGEVHELKDVAPQTLIDALQNADALIVRSKAHVTARVLEAAPRLKVIGRASPTVDHIDLKAARRRQVSVVYAPHVAVNSTAEFALALALVLVRRIPYFDSELRDGRFDAARTACGSEMGRLTLGLLGIDPVAERLAEIFRSAFGSPILAHDPTGRTAADYGGTLLSGERVVELDVLLRDADILSVHLPLSPETRRFLNADRLALMKPTAILINTSRGPTVDTVAVAQALRKRRLGGAGFDVYETEPLPATHPLRMAPHCVLTPHVAGATLDAASSRFRVVEDVVRVLQGEPPLHPVV